MLGIYECLLPCEPPVPKNYRTVWHDKPLISTAGKTPNPKDVAKERRDAIWAYLEAHPGSVSSALEAGIPCPRSTLSVILNEWLIAGKVWHTPVGRAGSHRILKKWSIVK